MQREGPDRQMASSTSTCTTASGSLPNDQGPSSASSSANLEAPTPVQLAAGVDHARTPKPAPTTRMKGSLARELDRPHDGGGLPRSGSPKSASDCPSDTITYTVTQRYEWRQPHDQRQRPWRRPEQHRAHDPGFTGRAVLSSHEKEGHQKHRQQPLLDPHRIGKRKLSDDRSIRVMSLPHEESEKSSPDHDRWTQITKQTITVKRRRGQNVEYTRCSSGKRTTGYAGMKLALDGYKKYLHEQKECEKCKKNDPHLKAHTLPSQT